MYEKLIVSGADPDPQNAELVKSMAATSITNSSSGDNGFFSSPFDTNDDHEQVQNESTASYIHPDLEDLTFGPLRKGPGSSTTKLPTPLKPSFHVLSDDDDHDDRLEQRASLSDFSDYESSDEDTHKANMNVGPSRRNYITVSDNDDEQFSRVPLTKNNVEDDPFADPFADEH